MRKLVLILTFAIANSIMYAQIAQTPEQIIGNIMESVSEKNLELNDHSQVFDDLVELYENPVNLNNAKAVDFEKLIFLTDIQIQNTLQYLKDNYPIYSKYQLQGIWGMTISDIENLLVFFYIGDEPTTKYNQKYFKGQTIVRDQFYIEKQDGYLQNENNHYIGNKHHIYSKTFLQYGNNLSAGITFDKDPGEILLTKGHPPIDFISAHIAYEGKKLLKTLIIGDFHANFGQGLALWSGTNMGKSTEPIQTRKRGQGFKKYTSANEYAFFRGVATTLQLKKMELSMFASLKKLDASINFDSLNHKTFITSITKTGYHRTPSELNKRNNLTYNTFGSNLKFYHNNLNLSIGAFYNHFLAHSFETKQLYQQFAKPNIESSHYWISYNYGYKNIIAFGESSLTNKGYWATLNGVVLNPANNVSLTLLHRYYHLKYFSLWTNSFSEYSNPSGESGFYLGLSSYPLAKLKFSGYMDVFKTEWLKYSLNKPSNGYEISLQGDYIINDQISAYLRYREKEKAINTRGTLDPAFNTTKYNSKKIRLHTSFIVDNNWSLQFRIEKSLYKELNNNTSEGLLAFTGIKYISNTTKLTCWARYTIFETDDYNSRIYAYENDLLYNFYTPSFQRDGSRVYFLFRYELLKNLRFWFKAGQTHYNNVEEIGSGLQKIHGNTRTQIKMQVQLKF
ncbi:helix-hairpin-helix domain-containing protein [Labilibacter sediminis]|nr:helix-hairpin-helix domain-containing protein [Labilibacter sediminis]